MLESGLYEQIINRAIQSELAVLEPDQYKTVEMDQAEAPLILSQYVANLLADTLRQIEDGRGSADEKREKQISIVNDLIRNIQEAESPSELIAEPAEELQHILSPSDLAVYKPAQQPVLRPSTSIRSGSLFTGALHEPSMDSELRNEITSADRIDMLVSFVKWSGLRLIYDELKAFCERGGRLRVITTSYMGATDIKAVERFTELPNCELKVSYDTQITRLHAKAYIFYRNTGFSTAYIGSSNLSNAALSSGLEWNVKIAAKELPETMQKIEMTFGSYWASADYEAYDESSYQRLRAALKAESSNLTASERRYFYDMHPYPFQQEILDRLEAERELRNHYRNLVVAATGTGKTVVAAFDYKRFAEKRKGESKRLLFIAHRREILEQSRDCFRQVLKDQNFGDLFVGTEEPTQINYLFMSVQSFNSRKWDEITAADFYDYIVVDEFHHAAAISYQRILDHYQPEILLGLTATPERMDGIDVSRYFDHRIAAEIRLPEAIERKLLVPFQYFGVSDNVDLSTLQWSRGGYDRQELSKVYTMDNLVAKRRVMLILEALERYLSDIDETIGLAFCVSVEHANYMARAFSEAGIPSLALTGTSKPDVRDSAQTRLRNGELRFIFTVDLYNEGVDIPEINTVLFLRPTESLTVLLQQLGRGLRHSHGKDCLTVIDFIGQAHRRYNYQEKFQALLSKTRKAMKHEINQGFPSVPKGCSIRLEKVATEYVLSNIRQATQTRRGLIDRLSSFEEDSGLPLSFENFMNYYHLQPMDIYRFDSFSRLRVQAGVAEDFNEADEALFQTAFKRISLIDSARWIRVIDAFYTAAEPRAYASFAIEEQQLLRMFYSTLRLSGSGIADGERMLEQLYDLKRNPTLMSELQDLLYWNFDHIDFVDRSIGLLTTSPLDLHCSYSRDQILTAFGYANPSSHREGVAYFAEHKLDILLVTLNKSDKDYSPSTMYEDYSINEHLFHWQSQSTTSESSDTGQRYINHRSRGSQILLFVRAAKQDSYGNAMPYSCLGLIDYLSHSGSRPMSITFKMHDAIPAKYLKLTDKVQAG